ncbi:hypothetical protein TGUWTKB_5360 [Candidatus Tachikawaea gelatinosa]|uniref:Uncharacterized protein n=1 Tax=Candidatus Tachikawaea gelatinosa TaxID=1410383 RepID=A0A090AQY4_9ENTR|nr:hypothetical protein TGUWTKB_5360 [Candidatus Tachikawaea gelatinosa]
MSIARLIEKRKKYTINTLKIRCIKKRIFKDVISVKKKMLLI